MPANTTGVMSLGSPSDIFQLEAQGPAFVSLYQSAIECRLPPVEGVPLDKTAPPSGGDSLGDTHL